MRLLQYLKREDLFLGLHCQMGTEAIVLAAKALCQRGYAKSPLIPSVVERHKNFSVYLGRGLAVAHAMEEGRSYVTEKGMVLLQFPEGVAFLEGTGYVVIGIAAKNEAHMELLSAIGETFSGDHTLSYRLARATSKEEIFEILK